jgi:hypothetical protein
MSPDTAEELERLRLIVDWQGKEISDQSVALAAAIQQRDAAMGLLRESLEYLDDGVPRKYWTEEFRKFRESVAALIPAPTSPNPRNT